MHAKVEEFTSLIEHEIECDKANTFLVIKLSTVQHKRKNQEPRAMEFLHKIE